MKKILVIIIGVYFTQTGFSQSINESPSVMPAKTIKAYEIKSESKVNEFYNYLELLSDPKINTEMKAHTSAEALKLFQSTAITVSNIFDKANTNIALKDFLEQVTRQKNVKFKLEGFSSHQDKHTATKQEWDLNYNLIINSKKTYTIRQKFFIVQEDKKFGNTTKKVWNTYLGDLSVIK
jgi:hypothetical protein